MSKKAIREIEDALNRLSIVEAKFNGGEGKEYSDFNKDRLYIESSLMGALKELRKEEKNEQNSTI